MSDESAVAEVVVNEPEVNLEPTETVDSALLDSEEPEAQEAAQDTEEALDKKDPWYKKRIDELTRDKHEARRQAERLGKLLCLLYTSPSPRDRQKSRMPSSA